MPILPKFNTILALDKGPKVPERGSSPLSDLLGKVIYEHPNVRFHDIWVVNLSQFIDKWGHQIFAFTGNIQTFSDFVFNLENGVDTKGFPCYSDSKRDRRTRIFFPESA